MEKAVVIGLGEVGLALYRLLKNCSICNAYGYDIDRTKTVDSLESIDKPVDYLHIAIPYTQDLADIVKYYAEIFKPKIIYIHSTVAIGTTRLVHKVTKITTAFTPVRGKHPNIVKHMLFWNKWVSSIPIDKVDECANHLKSIGLKVKMYRGPPESLELAKLWETVYRAIMIASWQELHRIARYFKADLEAVIEFVGEVHEVLKDRPIYFPGHIGGHCLIPNTKILMERYPSKLFEFVIESNNKRLNELRDENIKADVEHIKEIIMKYINLEYYEGKIE